MRHRKAGRKLKRTASHRRSLLASLSTALIRHKRITTTLAKAKETRPLVERLITRAKRAYTLKDSPAQAIHERRMVARLIRDHEVVGELFSSVAEKVQSRNGGYTRVVKLGQRHGDGAEMAVLELVDYNVGQEKAEKPAPARKKKPAPGAKSAPKEPKKTAEKKAAEKKAVEEKAARKKKPAKDQPPEKAGDEGR